MLSLTITLFLFFSDGSCKCAAGYDSFDCSADMSDPPTLITLQNGGQCEPVQDCNVLRVDGFNFFKSLQGSLKEIKVTFLI